MLIQWLDVRGDDQLSAVWLMRVKWDEMIDID